MRERRREWMLALGAALALPWRAWAQQPRVYQIGFLTLSASANVRAAFQNFDAGLRALGYVDGKNITIHWRHAGGNVERMPEVAAGLARDRMDVIVAFGAQAIRAAQQATTQIPIIMGATGDPVGSGFVKTLQRPGGNITGLSDVSTSEIGPKLLDLTRSTASPLTHVALLTNPDNASHRTLEKTIPETAKALKIKVTILSVRATADMESAFNQAIRERVEAVIVPSDTTVNSYGKQIAAIAEKHRLPVVSSFFQYADAGGLVSYGVNVHNSVRRAAVYVDKVLKGANPAELPVEQAAKIELVVNRRAAKAIGLSLPSDLLLRADRVID